MPEPNLDYAALFKHLPERYILFTANDPDFTFVDVSDPHSAMTGVPRSKLIGKNFFEVFPDTSEAFQKTGKSELRDIFLRVIKTKKPVSLTAFRYDIPQEDGAFSERYWEPIHYPIFDTHKKVSHILQISKDVTEELQKERQLHQAQQQLEQALSAGSLGIWNWDIPNDIITGDKNLANFFGVSYAEAANGLPLSVFTNSIHADDQQRVIAEIQKTVTQKGSFDQDYRTIDHQKKMRWVTARGTVETDEHNNAVNFTGMLIDITARKNIEAKLQASIDQFQALADSMPQLIWVTRPDGYHEYYNKAWYDYTGTTYEQAKGKGWNETFHPDDQTRSAKRWQHSLKTGEPYEIEYRLRGITGEYKWFVGRALPYRDASGTIIKWYGTCTYIEDQKRATERQTFLSEATKVLASSFNSKKTLTRIAKTITDEIADWCSIDIIENGSVKNIALHHADIHKLEIAKEFIALRAADSATADASLDAVKSGKSLFIETLTPEMLAQSLRSARELELMQQLGLQSVIYVPLKDATGVFGVITLVRSEQRRNFSNDDVLLAEELASRISMMLTNISLYTNAQAEIKRRKKLENELLDINENLEAKVIERTKELEKSNIELSRSNQELQNFAYVASHDLQEPLRKIQAFGDILESEYTEQIGDGTDYLHRMQSAASRMSILINDLLSFSRVTTQAKSFKQVDLNTVLENVIEDLYARIHETNGTVTVDTLPAIYGDDVQMRQLFQNLISNALKFHKPDVTPVIKITVKQRNGYYFISVKDNGIGFDTKYNDRIFAVFQRLHARGEYEGTGIGLAVCRKIVERHDGTIDVKSIPGEGSEFIIKLPDAKEAL